MKKFTIAFAAILLLLGMTSADAAPKKEKIKIKSKIFLRRKRESRENKFSISLIKTGTVSLATKKKKLLKYSERTTKAKELNLLRCSTQTVMASLAKMKEKP
jgi:hypothetical protein